MTTHKFNSLREKIAHDKAERIALRAKFAQDLADSFAVAQAKAEAVTPEPMLIRNTMTGEVHTVPDGPCGFAWITVRPRNCKLAKFCEGELGWRNSSWHKRIELSVQAFGQSHTLKETFAQAFAEHMNTLGHSGVGWDSRFD